MKTKLCRESDFKQQAFSYMLAQENQRKADSPETAGTQSYIREDWSKNTKTCVKSTQDTRNDFEFYYNVFSYITRTSTYAGTRCATHTRQLKLTQISFTAIIHLHEHTRQDVSLHTSLQYFYTVFYVQRSTFLVCN